MLWYNQFDNRICQLVLKIQFWVLPKKELNIDIKSVKNITNYTENNAQISEN